MFGEGSDNSSGTDEENEEGQDVSSEESSEDGSSSEVPFHFFTGARLLFFRRPFLVDTAILAVILHPCKARACS